MLSILGSLLGFASSAVPAITDSFARKQDNKHELDMARKFSNENKLMFNIRAGNPKGMEDSEGKQRDTVFNSKIHIKIYFF